MWIPTADIVDNKSESGTNPMPISKKPPTRKSLGSRHAARAGIGAGMAILALLFIPYGWCSRESDLWFSGDFVSQSRLAEGVEQWVHSPLETNDFNTGSDRFNGEWLFGTYVMAGLGFAQTATEHPQLKPSHVDIVETCIDKLTSPIVHQFDSKVWNEIALDALDSDNGHAAYLGYLNLLMSMTLQIDPRNRYADLNRDVTQSLVKRIKESPSMLLATYPGEVYPVDNCAVIASIAIYNRVTRGLYQGLIDRWVKKCRQEWIDPQTGLLYQAMTPLGDAPLDQPRGSGSALAAYFLSFVDRELSAELYQAVKRELTHTWIGFGCVREYPNTVRGGPGDIDSGPLVFGYSASATGFSLAGSRIHNDPALFSSLYSTAYLFGTPLDREKTRTFVSGGPLGNAILFAMLTAQPAQAVEHNGSIQTNSNASSNASRNRREGRRP